MTRFILLAFLLVPLSARAYVWTSFNFTEVSPFDGLTRNLRISIPDDYPYVRGILVNFNALSGDTRAEHLQTYFTEFCRVHQFAFIGTEGFSQPSTNSNESALRAFTNSIASFATQSGRPEINNAPFVFHAVSGGIGPQNIVIRTNASKVIAYSAGSGTFGDPPSIAATQILNVPGLLWAGDNDVSGVANKMESFVATNRPSGLLASYAEMDLTTHAQSSLLHAAGMGFLNEMIQLSYPSGQCVLNGPLTLTRLAESSGWLIDSNTIRTVFETTTNYAAYAGSKPTAYWVPNKNMAYVHRAFATHLPPISLSAPVNETEVNPGASITITVNTASFAGWTNMAIFSYSTNLANFTSGTASFVMSNVVEGVYVFSAIGTRGGTNVTTKPVMVSVRKLTAPSYPCLGNIWYAATNGTACCGTLSQPWDLQTALNKTATIVPGDFLYLRSGNYTHVPQATNCATCDQPGWIFQATIAGTVGNQITVMSHPGEWAKIDGGAFVHYAANARPTLKSGTGSGLQGSYITYKNLEFYSSSTETRHSFDNSGPGGETFPRDISRSEGPVAAAPGVKFINNIIHDLTTGISIFNIPNMEAYGNVIFNNGWQGTPQRHGHGMYIQTPTSAGGFLSTVKHNILAGAYKMNIQAYGSSDAEVSHLRFQENIFIGQQGQYGGMLLGTLDGGANDRLQDNEFTDNFGYGADLNLYQEADHNVYHSLKVFDNYMVHSKLRVSSWKNLTLTNNTFITPIDVAFGNVSLKTIPSSLGAQITTWNMDRNNYRFSPAFTNPFNWDGVPSGNYTLAQWRANTGYDLNSVLTTTGPTGTNIIVQPNAYDDNRAHIAVYNWDGATHVAANISSLGWAVGDGVTIRNAQDYFGDLESALVTSTNTIVLDMQAASHTVAVPFGAPAAIIPKTFPAFGAFVLERISEVPPPAGTNFTVTVASFPISGVPITFSPADFNGAGDGTTSFSRTNATNVVTTLIAPGTVDTTYVFSNWTRNGQFYTSSLTATFTNTADSQWQANYDAPKMGFTVFSQDPASGVFIQLSPADDGGLSNGNTPITRTYVAGTIVTLTAPLASDDGNVFLHWKIGPNPVSTSLTYNYLITILPPNGITAVYATPSPPPAGSTSFSGRRRGVRL